MKQNINCRWNKFALYTLIQQKSLYIHLVKLYMWPDFCKFLSSVVQRGSHPVASSHLQIFDSTVSREEWPRLPQALPKLDVTTFSIKCCVLSSLKGSSALKSFLHDFQGVCADGTSVKISLWSILSGHQRFFQIAAAFCISEMLPFDPKRCRAQLCKKPKTLCKVVPFNLKQLLLSTFGSALFFC